MIINERNKNSIISGKIKRGFSQPPKELKEKLYNNLHIYPSSLTQKREIETPKNDPQSLKKAIDSMRKINK